MLPHSSQIVAKALLAEYWPEHTARAVNDCISKSHALYPVLEIQLSSIKPFERAPGVSAIVKEAAVSLIRGFELGSVIPPVVVELESAQSAISRREYRLKDGYHRYYLALAAGCERIRAAVRPAPVDAA